ncbi:MAG: isoprenylcysteine carboxylmethyltransferase family protein [Alphaproteobacteria bacterium]|nr:MAG: isoprenylcysteine carboxylmethyltransferase family protein [Alphaproteobacteria bacterium]
MPHAETIALYGPTGLIILALIWGFGRILWLSRTGGVSVLAIFRRRKSPVEWWLMVIAIILDAYLLVRPFWPAIDLKVYAAPSPFPHYGVAIMAAGIGLAMLSQVVMGTSWRIGVPERRDQSHGLVTGGLYRFSRNPIYVGIMLFLMGAVVVVPGPIPILSLVMSWPLINHIIRAEEKFLTAEFGDAYSAYCQRVRRWL